MKLLTLALLSSALFANELTITAFYMLDRGDTSNSSAEVCFALNPAPEAPTFAQITVDAGFNSQGEYTAIIDERGSVCHVVSTLRGRVEVVIPNKGSAIKSL